MSGKIRHELRRDVVTEEFRTEFLGEFRPSPPAFELFVLEPLKRNLADVSAVLDELCREYADVLWRLEHYPPHEGVEHFVFLSGPPDFPQIQPLARVDVRLSVASGTVTWNVVRAVEPRPEWRMNDRQFEDLLQRRAKARALQAETKLGGG